MYYRGISLTLCRIIVKNMPVHTVQQIEIANKVQLMIFTLYDLLLSPVLYYLLFTDDINLDEQEEKARLISQVMELQNTLDDLSQRVDSVKEENLKLKSENQVLGQYIENLMAASSVFQSTSPRVKKK